MLPSLVISPRSGSLWLGSRRLGAGLASLTDQVWRGATPGALPAGESTHVHRGVPVRCRGWFVAFTVSLHWRVCQTARPGCHGRQPARAQSSKIFDGVFPPPLPSPAPCPRELCSASSCRGRTPCPAPHTSCAPCPLAASSGGSASRCQDLLGPSLARPVFSGFQGPCLFWGPRTSLGFWLSLGLGPPQGLLVTLQPGHRALLGPRPWTEHTRALPRPRATGTS